MVPVKGSNQNPRRGILYETKQMTEEDKIISWYPEFPRSHVGVKKGKLKIEIIRMFENVEILSYCKSVKIG